MFQTKVLEEIKTQILYSNIFPKIMPFIKYAGECRNVGQVTNDGAIALYAGQTTHTQNM